MADGHQLQTVPTASVRVTPIDGRTPEQTLVRQRLSRELFGWEHEFTIANRPHATPPEIERTLEDLTQTGEDIVKLVRSFEDRFSRTIAASPRFAVNVAFLADLLADTLGEGLTEDAARVLVAAVKRELS